MFRAATDADCRCDSELRMMREGDGGIWKPVHDYHPYVVTGDFNGDGVTDFAVAVVNTSRAVRKFTLLVFNGPLRSSRANPAFVESNVDMTSTGFFYGPPRPKPYRLVIGKFESEGTALVPHGKTYRYEEISSVEE